MSRLWIAGLLLIVATSGSAPAAELAPDAHQSQVARMLALNMPLRHLSREPLDDHISTNALEIFLTALDFERTYFLASDVADFRLTQNDLDDQLKAGDVTLAYKIYNIYKTRVSNRTAYVKELLNQGFDLTQNETYDWKRKDAPWPADEEAWNDLKMGNYWPASDVETNKVTIRNMYLAYFEPISLTNYLQPIYVFEGDGKFAAYVPAVTDNFIK